MCAPATDHDLDCRLGLKCERHQNVYTHPTTYPFHMVAEQRGGSAASLVDALILLIMEEVIEAINVVLRERIAKRICEHIVDVHKSQVVAQATEEPKTSSRDRTSQQHAAEQILNDPVPEMVTQWMEVPNTVSQDRIKQRTLEHISEIPVPQVVEELAEISKVFSLDGVQQRFGGQIIETLALSLDEKIVEMPVTRKTQQVANTHVQHVVNTVEAEMPKIIEETVQRMKPINQETKRIEVSPLLFTDKAVDVLVVGQRQVSHVWVVKQTVEDPQFEIVQKTVENSETVPQVHVVEKTVERPQSQIVEQIDEIPETRTDVGTQTSEKAVEISQLQAVEKIVETGETQTIQGIQTSAPLHQVHLTGSMKPDDPDAKIKFLAEEELYGVGGPVFDANENRVANELGKQDCVTGEMWENKPPFSLALNKATSDDIAWQRSTNLAQHLPKIWKRSCRRRQIQSKLITRLL